MIGFHGQRRALDSNPETNPLGEDVAKGWHAQLKEKDQFINAATLAGQTHTQLIKKPLRNYQQDYAKAAKLSQFVGVMF